MTSFVVQGHTFMKWFNKKNEQIIWQNGEIVFSLYFTVAGYLFIYLVI